MTEPAPISRPPTDPPQATPTPLGQLSLWRVWHPDRHIGRPTDFRSYGPLFRFDPHAPGAPREHGPRGPFVWYGAFLFDTSVCERFARGAEVVDICPQMRATFVAVADVAAVFDLTDTDACESLSASAAVGDTFFSSYDLTQDWTRHLHRAARVHGLRYWSARHRTKNGDRYGINTVLWRKRAIGRPRHQHRLIDDALWPHVIVALDAAGVAVNRVASCAVC